MFIKFCTEYSGLKNEKLVVEQQSIHTAFSQLKTSKMNGWLHYGSSEELTQTLDRITKTAEYVKENADTFIIVGAGGFYLGSRAVIEALTPHFERSGVRILFAGNT